ncbi:MAG: hypothetical protein DMF68_21950 [Acidobacteria bacterium]|nr:MAG: hypothetical protein DMF68_21950 [Acidobacteriota bacterium]
MNLTKEYFDKALKSLATKADLKGLATKKELEKFATKADLEKQTQYLMAYSSDQIEGLARMVNDGFVDLQGRLDVKERVVKLERELKKIKEALQV